MFCSSFSLFVYIYVAMILQSWGNLSLSEIKRNSDCLLAGRLKRKKVKVDRLQK